ncbi:iron-containing alcohol dehydrogenase [Kitasatospora aureofaciens]|uniref:3-dehydroquinate synthase family protein n=1 Tax=Kitasatospora aureofaciens TaxID=1894 RepID=UPI0037C75F7E
MKRENWQSRQVAIGDARYPYYFGHDCADRIASELGRYDADRFLVVTDDTVLGLHGQTLLTELAAYAPVEVLTRPPGESMKSLSTLSSLLDRAIGAGASRRSVVVAFGGGVPGNLAGLLAGLLFRGVRLVHVPTTTVAAMDSTLSLKQAVNSAHGKNHIGMYHTPDAVFTDVRFLQTLPDRELRSGLCEATKNCLAIRPGSAPELRRVLTEGRLASPESLLWLLEESLTAKEQATVGDTKEQASGLVLEYGHTVGHAVELCDQRLGGAAPVSHGEAIAFGMLAAARMSAAIGGLGAEEVALHDELVHALGAPTRLPPGLRVEDVMSVVRVDNKRGYLRIAEHEAAVVLLEELGVPFGSRDCPLTAVDLDLVEEVLNGLSDPDQHRQHTALSGEALDVMV